MESPTTYKAYGLELNDTQRGILMCDSTWYALTTSDIDNIKLPRYRRKNFLEVKNLLCYKGFRNDMVGLNKFPITRRQMDACWMKLLFRFFKKWKPDSTTVQPFGPDATSQPAWMYIKLGQAIGQRHGTNHDDVERWWADQAKKYPGLDITPTVVDVDTDHPGLLDNNDSDSEGGQEINARGLAKLKTEGNMAMGDMDGDGEGDHDMKEAKHDNTEGEEDPMDTDGIEVDAQGGDDTMDQRRSMFSGPLVMR